MRKIIPAVAAALIASAAFASTASAFDYYQGVLPSAGLPATHSAEHASTAKAKNSVDYGYTGSIASNASSGKYFDGTPDLGRGDYYEGVNRPN